MLNIASKNRWDIFKVSAKKIARGIGKQADSSRYRQAAAPTHDHSPARFFVPQQVFCLVLSVSCVESPFLRLSSALPAEYNSTEFSSFITREGIPSMAVKLTERAAQEVRRFQKEHNFEDSMVLRIGVAGGGCSGFNYTLNFDDSFDEKADSKYDCHGVPVVVDKKSSLYLDGTTVDWHESLEKQGFTFENPNAVKSCGCGSSFQA
jgi:iron-sulfur cluster assembly accessory protein